MVEVKNKPAKPDVTSFTLSTKSTRGFTSKMTGKMRSPEHFGVVTAALVGYLSDDADLLHAAPDLLEAARLALNYIESTESKLGITLGSGDALRAAISKASPNLPSASQEGGE